jgi:DNA-binding GntR family transcriptional regulator
MGDQLCLEPESRDYHRELVNIPAIKTLLRHLITFFLTRIVTSASSTPPQAAAHQDGSAAFHPTFDVRALVRHQLSAINDHLEILAALEAGYADKAAALMLHHLTQSQSQNEAA